MWPRHVTHTLHVWTIHVTDVAHMSHPHTVVVHGTPNNVTSHMQTRHVTRMSHCVNEWRHTLASFTHRCYTGDSPTSNHICKHVTSHVCRRYEPFTSHMHISHLSSIERHGTLTNITSQMWTSHVTHLHMPHSHTKVLHGTWTLANVMGRTQYVTHLSRVSCESYVTRPRGNYVWHGSFLCNIKVSHMPSFANRCGTCSSDPRQRHVTYVISHMWVTSRMSRTKVLHGTPFNVMSNTSCHRCVMSSTTCHIRHVTYVHESCHSHVTHVSHKQVPNWTLMYVSHATHTRHVTHVSESRHTHTTHKGATPDTRQRHGPNPQANPPKHPSYTSTFSTMAISLTPMGYSHVHVRKSLIHPQTSHAPYHTPSIHCLQTDLKRKRAVHTTHMYLM